MFQMYAIYGIWGLVALAVAAYALLQIGSYIAGKRAEAKYPPIGDFLFVNGIKLHYVKKGSGPPVVLIHGAGGNVRDWDFKLMDKLAQDFTVIAFDRPGHGYTGCLNSDGETLAEQANLMAAALKLLGYREAIILGYSFGGAVALSWAIHHPRMVRGLCLLAAVSNPWVLKTSWLYDWGASKLTSWFFNPFLSGFVPNLWVRRDYRSIFAPQKPPNGFLDHVGVPLTVRAHSFRANSRQIAKLKPQINAMVPKYDGLLMPVEILHGTADRTVPIKIHSDILNDQIPNSIYRRVEGMGHGLHQLIIPTIVDSVERLNSSCIANENCL